MDTLTGMRTFCAVAEARSFNKAAAQLGISPALTSKYIAQLEARLGVRLLNRTTRSLALTQTGREYLSRAKTMIREFDALEESIQDTNAAPKGHLRLSAPRILGETYLIDLIADFLEIHPEITIELKLTDRFVNLIEEGFDLVIRGGALKDSSLIARKLAPSNVLHCASPAYLARHGTPQHPYDLTEHRCIVDSNFESQSHWSFAENAERISVAVNGPIIVNSARACRNLALRDLGIMHTPSQMVTKQLAEGKLIRILQAFELLNAALYVVYPHTQHLPTKTRALTDFLVTYFAEKQIYVG